MISSVNKGQKIDSEHFQTPTWSFTAPKFDVKMAQADEPIYINFCSLKSALIVSDSSLSHFSEVFSTKKFVFSLNIHDFITIFLFFNSLCLYFWRERLREFLLNLSDLKKSQTAAFFSTSNNTIGAQVKQV